MKTISVSKFKAHLSAELAKVKKGAELVVTDHDFPVAWVKPYSTDNNLSIEPAKLRPHGLKMDHGIRIDVDPVRYLLEDRNR